jgi:pimeloyl-ACP methyl ester carboxylesterase
MSLPLDDLWITAPDGLRLHALSGGPRNAPRLPVVCLPGLARTVEDFRPLLERLTGNAERPCRVLALDARGRGRSERDKNPANYSVAVELADVLAVLDATGITRAIFLGTSRGGILTMALAVARPAAIGGVVLNDIGPVLDMAGLLRIKQYVGRMPRPDSWSDAVHLLRSAMGGHFPALDDAGWDAYARTTWREGEDGLEHACDPALAEVLKNLDPAEPQPTLWPQFDALPQVPLMVIRGEFSDLLSRETVAAMRARRPDLKVVEIAGQGHAPLLRDDVTIEPIAAFVARCIEKVEA